MKTAQEIASQVKDPAGEWNRRRQYQTTVAQDTILKALDITANNYGHAEEIFKALGIGVDHKRVGRSSVPVVSKIDKSGGAFNVYGEGETWDNYAAVDVDLSAIDEWMVQ